MKHLDTEVNIIPIIAKSDTISKNELNSSGIKIYRFPTDDKTLA
jgi:septin 6/8/11